MAVIIPILLLLVKKSLRRPNTQQAQASLPPGPRPLPIIGNLHNLFGQLPHRALRRLADVYGPVMRLRFGQVNLIVVSSPEAAREIVKTHDLNFSDRAKLAVGESILYGPSDIILSPYGEYWRQLRKIAVVHLLSAQRVKSLAACRRDEILKLLRDITVGAGCVDLGSKLRSLSSAITARSAFGSECRHSGRFISAMKDMNKVASGFSMADLFPNVMYIGVITGMEFKVQKIRRQMDGILEQILEEHRGRRPAEGEDEDLVDVLLRIKDSGGLEIPLTDDNVKAVILDIFLAGTETTSTTIHWVMAELIKNPRCMEKVQEELRQALKGKTFIEEADLEGLHYFKLVIRETMRLHPALPLLVPRQSIKSCEVYGYRVDERTRIVINAWALGRDPRYWKDPETFNPERFVDSLVDFRGTDFEFLPFGGGRRMCPGITFGMAIVELALANLLFYFNWDLPTGMELEDFDMTENFGSAVGRKSKLCLEAHAYSPSTVKH